MKNLIVVRHAKSSWENNLPDEERPLNKRGITDAPLVSGYLKDKISRPDFVYSSPANRALTTCRLFLENLNISDNFLEITKKLYDFGGSKLTSFIQSLPDNYNNVMIFGHNHAITAFVNNFGSQYIDNVPTSGVVIIEFDIEHWKDLKQGKTMDFIVPKMLK